MGPNARLNKELTDFLAKRGEYEHDIDVWPTPARPATPLTGADLRFRAPLRPADEGVKHDGGKAPLSWLGQVSRALEDVARSLAHGARKYSPENWRRVPEGSRRYRDAALRHLMADLRGEHIDPEQGVPHVAIAALNLLMAAEHDRGF